MGRERTIEDTPAGRPPLVPALQPAIFKDSLVKPANTSLSPGFIKTDLAGCVKGTFGNRDTLAQKAAYW
jgi:hypothetical protein